MLIFICFRAGIKYTSPLVLPYAFLVTAGLFFLLYFFSIVPRGVLLFVVFFLINFYMQGSLFFFFTCPFPSPLPLFNCFSTYCVCGGERIPFIFKPYFGSCLLRKCERERERKRKCVWVWVWLWVEVYSLFYFYLSLLSKKLCSPLDIAHFCCSATFFFTDWSQNLLY